MYFSTYSLTIQIALWWSSSDDDWLLDQTTEHGLPHGILSRLSIDRMMARIFAVSDSNHDEQSRSRWGSIEGDRFNSMSWLADQEHRSHVTIISNIHHLGSDTYRYSSSAHKRESDLLRSLPCGLNFYPFAGSQSASWLQNKSRFKTNDTVIRRFIVGVHHRSCAFILRSLDRIRSIDLRSHEFRYIQWWPFSIDRSMYLWNWAFPNWAGRIGVRDKVTLGPFLLSGSMGGRQAGVS